MNKILIVDDERNMRLVLKAILRKEGYDVELAADGLEALAIMDRHKVAAVVTDLKMPRLDGIGLLDRIMEDYPAVPVIIITAHGTVASAVDALKRGAFDYITKPFDQDELKGVIAKAVKTWSLNEDEILDAMADIESSGIIGSSPGMREVFDVVGRVAPTTTTILITGETGTGKELVANAVHRSSPRRNNPFIKINCAAIAENLLESELFGYEKGAFTGAVGNKLGRFELAHKGTLFLDEVGELPRDMQVKLLRAIQDQEFERVGGVRTIKVDVRLIAATNRNLLEDVRQGRFREDLYYRLNVLPIHLPPLRERAEDIGPLTDYFRVKFNRKLEKAIRTVDLSAREIFALYPWPGNIRELENLMERLVLMARGDAITLEDLPVELRNAAEDRAAANGRGEKKPFKEFVKSHMEDVERQMIITCLEECGDNVTRAAERLGLSRKGLQLKMIKYNLRKENLPR